MEKELVAITELDNWKEIEQWFDDAEKQTIKTLPSFVKHVMNDYIHDYGTVCHAIGACAVATAYACTKMYGAHGGITGFQAGFVMWSFVKGWYYRNNKCGLKILDYDKLLYPQYCDRFEKTIESEQWEAIREEAKHLIQVAEETNDPPHERVLAHWKSIAVGNLPFGFRVDDENKG